MNSLSRMTILATLLLALAGCRDRTAPESKPEASLAPEDPAAAAPDELTKLMKQPEFRGFAQAHSRAIASIAFAPRGRQLASASWDNTVKLWDLAQDEPKELAAFAGSPSGIAYLADGKLLATGSAESRVVVWDVAALPPTVRWNLSGHKHRPFALATTPDGKMLASGALGPVLRLWKLNDGEPDIWAALANETAPSVGVSSLSFSGDGKLLAAGSHLGKQTLRVWDVAGEVLDERTLPTAQARLVLFAPKEPVLAFAGDDADIHCWSFAGTAANPLRVLKGHEAAGLPTAVKALAFSADGTVLASGGQDRRLILWNTATGKVQREWQLPVEVRALAFSPDGLRLAVGNDDGSLCVLCVP